MNIRRGECLFAPYCERQFARCHGFRLCHTVGANGCLPGAQCSPAVMIAVVRICIVLRHNAGIRWYNKHRQGTMKPYFRYWGKAEKDGPGYHLLPYHCLDVAAVAAAWWDSSPTIRRAFLPNNDLTTDTARAWMLFFISLHDYGKFDIRFQFRAKEVWQLLYPDAGTYKSLPSFAECKSYFHGSGGLFWFRQDNLEMLGLQPEDSDNSLSFLDDLSESDSSKWQSWKTWAEAVTGHHGHIRRSEYTADASLSVLCDPLLAKADRLTRQDWLRALEKKFLIPAGLSLNDSPPECSPLLAGFCSVADWMGSRCTPDSFPYCQEPLNIDTYFETRRDEDARRILELSGVVGKSRSYVGVSTLLKPGQQPHSMQTLIDDLPLKPALTIIEAPTGSGKTEAALAYAWRLIAAGLADSIVFALPTQATANAMLGRLERIAILLFEDHPNVLLAHGSARFNDKFIDLKHAALSNHEEEDGWAQCSEWLAQSRKRIFLGQIGVCTIDQVLISVLPVKHRFVRGFGIGRSVLIVDEVHAYDSYMYGLLEEVLRQQKVAGSSAVLLSATLPECQKQKLCEAWGTELEYRSDETSYPLVTSISDYEMIPFKLADDQQPQTWSINLEPISIPDMLPDDGLTKRIVVAAQAGAQVAIVCNLVNDAQRLAQMLRLEYPNIPVDLFHARYCFIHRKEKELSVISHFGPDGDRKKGRILVATQVIEQSLDLDFDWTITQLCPVDLLFQRIGRLHRHKRDIRPFGFEHPLCTILLPEGIRYGDHEYIYANSRVLWRTQKILFTTHDSRVVFPEAYRTWIEAVYMDEPWGEEPDQINEKYEKFMTDFSVSRYKALQMIHTAANPMSDTDEIVTAVTRDGDMNITVLPFCANSVGTMLMDGTILETVDEYKRLEVLSLNSIGVPKSWEHYLGGKDEEGRFRLEMKKEGDSFTAISKGKTFYYHKDIGMEMKK